MKRAIINKNRLVEQAEKVLKGTRKTSTEDYDKILIVAKNGRLEMTTTCTAITVKAGCSAEIEEPFECTVNALLFVSALSKSLAENVEISVSEKTLFIKSGMRVNLPLLNEWSGITIKAFDEEKATVLNCRNLGNYTTCCQHSLAAGDANMKMASFKIGVSNSGCEVIALDGKRISLRKDANVDNDKITTVICNGKSMMDALKIVGDNCTIVIPEERDSILLKGSDEQVMLAVMDQDFYDINSILQSKSNTRITAKKEDFMNALNVASLVDGKVIFEIKESVCNVKSSNYMGNTETDVAVKNESNIDFSIAFRNSYVMDALKSIKSETVDMYIKNSYTPMFITTTDDEVNITEVICPIKL